MIVLNRGSGKKDVDGVRRTIDATMRAAGRVHEVVLVTDPRRIADIAAAAVARAVAQGGVVVAAGGDGTINAVAQATLGSGRPFGVLPQGTFNYFSRTHGIPSDTAEASKLLLTARAHPAQVGWVNDRVFLVNASLGLYPRLLEDREGYKRRWGRSRPVALLAALITVWRGSNDLLLDIDAGDQARRLPTSTLIVANNQLQLEQMGLPEADAVQHGRLAAISLKPGGALARYGLLLRAAAGRLEGADDVERFVFRSMTVVSRRAGRGVRLKVATDGEVTLMTPPIVFRVAAQPLMLLRPEDGAMVRE